MAAMDGSSKAALVQSPPKKVADEQTVVLSTRLGDLVLTKKEVQGLVIEDLDSDLGSNHR